MTEGIIQCLLETFLLYTSLNLVNLAMHIAEVIAIPYSGKVWGGEKFGELTLFEYLAKESLVN